MKIVAFPYHDWRKGDVEGMRWRDAHILVCLERHPAVESILVIDRPVSLAERTLRRTSTRARGQLLESARFGRSVATLTQVASKTTVLDIRVTDILGPIRDRYRWWFHAFGEDQVLAATAWATSYVSPEQKVQAIAWTPTVEPAIARIEPNRFLFDSLDNWLLHPHLRRYADLVEPAYARILDRADSVFVSASRSKDVLRRWHGNIQVVANGVDPTDFARDFNRPADLPSAKIVGYAGSIGRRIDAELVTHVARSLPDVTFVFIGQTLDADVAKHLVSQRNVLYLGDRHYSKVPSYVRSFDIAWIPHSVGDGESGGDPIKMYEYWAAGRQVIATRIDGLDQWASQLHLVDSPGEAVSIIAAILGGTAPMRDVGVPASRTWDAITQRVVDELS